MRAKWLERENPFPFPEMAQYMYEAAYLNPRDNNLYRDINKAKAKSQAWHTMIQAAATISGTV